MTLQSSAPPGTGRPWHGPSAIAAELCLANGLRESLALSSLANDQSFRDDLAALIPELRAYARGLSGHPELADIIVQDTMIRGWTERSQRAAGADLKVWLFRLVRSQFQDHLHRGGAQATALAEYSAQSGNILRALQLLAPDLRETLLLVGASNLPFDLAAEIMDCSVNSARNRYARGRHALALIRGGSAGT